MAVIDLSTAGIRFGYATETTAGTKPSTFTNVPHPKEIPDMNNEPNALDTSHLNIPAGGFKTYTEGLKDTGGSIAITIGMSASLLSAWNTMVAAAKTALESNKETWFVLYHPGLTDSFFFTGIPSELNFPSASVDEVWDATVYIVPTDIKGWDTAINPTDPS